MKDVFDAFLEKACHFGVEIRKTNARRPIAISRKKRRKRKNETRVWWRGEGKRRNMSVAGKDPHGADVQFKA